MSLRPELADRQYFPIKFSIDGTLQTIYPTTCNPFYYINWVNYFEFKNSITPLPKPTPPNGLWSYYYLSNIVDNASTASVSINIEPELSIRRNVYVYVCAPAGFAGTNATSTDYNYINGGGGGGGSGCVYSFIIPKNSETTPVSINYNNVNGVSVTSTITTYETIPIEGDPGAITINITYTTLTSPDILCGQNGGNGTAGQDNGTNDGGAYGLVGGAGGTGGAGGAGGGGGIGGFSTPGPNGTVSYGTNGKSGAYEQTTTSNITTNNENYNNSNGNTYEMYGGVTNIVFADGLTCSPIMSGYGGDNNGYDQYYKAPAPPGLPTTSSTWTPTSGSPLNGFILVMYEVL